MCASLALSAAACGSEDDAPGDAEAAAATLTSAANESVASTTQSTSTETNSDSTSDSSTAPTTPAPTPPSTPAPTSAAPTAPPTAPPTTVPALPPLPRVLIIGDSTLAAVENNDLVHVLRGMDPVFEARSCRAIGVPSCGRNPAPNAVAVVDAAEAPFDIVVIMGGYDEWWETFSTSFDALVASARAKGVSRVLWLTYTEDVDYELPDGTPANQSLVNMNQILRDKVASGAYPDVLIADWNAYSHLTEGWYNDDDVHLSPTGAHGVADYISRKVAFAVNLPCPMPREPGVPNELPCPDPDVTGPVPDVVALYAA